MCQYDLKNDIFIITSENVSISKWINFLLPSNLFNFLKSYLVSLPKVGSRNMCFHGTRHIPSTQLDFSVEFVSSTHRVLCNWKEWHKEMWTQKSLVWLDRNDRSSQGEAAFCELVCRYLWKTREPKQLTARSTKKGTQQRFFWWCLDPTSELSSLADRASGMEKLLSEVSTARVGGKTVIPYSTTWGPRKPWL